MDQGTPDQVQAAAKRKAAADTPQDRDAQWIAALLEERHGYVTRGGMDDRVAAVDAALQAAGHVPADKPTPRAPRAKS